LTFSPGVGGNPFGRWQGTCPYHALSEKTGCTKSISLKSAHDSARCKLLVMWWCIQAPEFSRKRFHGSVSLRSMEECPYPEDVMFMRASMLPEAPSRRDVLDDVTLDAVGVVGESDAPPTGTDDAGASSRRGPTSEPLAKMMRVVAPALDDRPEVDSSDTSSSSSSSSGSTRSSDDTLESSGSD